MPTPIAEAGAGPPEVWPLLGQVLSLTPGEVLIVQRTFCLDEDLFLSNHTLGRRISSPDPELRGLPIMPLTFSMEILAEAASRLVADRQLVEMRDVRTYRWISLETETVTLEIEAKRLAADQVYVQIRDVGVNASPIVEGTILFGDRRPQPPQAEPLPIRGLRRSNWKPDDLYRTGMFHGPVFQGVLSMDYVGEDGAEATLVVKEPNGLFHTQRAPAFVTDPVLLDQPGQVVGFWTAELLAQGYVIFPYFLQSLRLYDVKPAGRACCRAHIELIGEQRVRSDLDIVGDDGRVWMRLVGWEDRRFDLPRSFFDFIQAPDQVVLSRPWSGPAFWLPEGCQLYRFGLADYTEDFFTVHGGIWQKVLAHLVLSRRERALWHGLRTPPRRRLEWLLGRVAGKDAVRHLLRQRYGFDLFPADIEILPDPEGRPLVHGPWLAEISHPPVLSISHSGGTAAAIAGPGEEFTGAGVDVESLGRVNDAVVHAAFTPQEQALLASLPGEEWLTRFWCAKEAVAKAARWDFSANPKAFWVNAVDGERGIVQVLVDTQPAEGRRAPQLSVFTHRDGDLIIAASVKRTE